MRDLKLDESGDLIISGHDLQFVNDTALTLQKVKQVLSTNKGEQFSNEDEGIDFRVFYAKTPNQDEILDTITDGLRQVDETFSIKSYSFTLTKQRRLILSFVAVNDSGEEISLAVGETQTIQNGKTVKTIVCALTAEEILTAKTALEAVCICDTNKTIINSTL